jgi:hypothetical protein
MYVVTRKVSLTNEATSAALCRLSGHPWDTGDRIAADSIDIAARITAYSITETVPLTECGDMLR